MRGIAFFSGEDEDTHKRRRKGRKGFLIRRLKQALFLSVGFLLVSVSVFALSSDEDALMVLPKESLPSERQKKDLCMVFLEQEFWDSFSQKGDVSREDRLAECRNVVSGEGSLSEGSDLEREIRELTQGFPLESMSPLIARFDRDIAALIVGIAKKESAWGKRVPRDGTGGDCFNYWGYTGAGGRGVAMGHACFSSPEEAVTTVGNRLVELVSIRNTSDPSRMTIWKCGSSCAGHSPESVRKWISDVDLYYRKIARI